MRRAGLCGSVATLCPACDGWPVRSGSVASGRMRFAMGLAIVGAVLLITGLLMVFVSEALRLKYGHSGPEILRAGELVAFSGLGIGVALLVMLAIGRGDRGRAGRGGHGRHGGVGGAGAGGPRGPAPGCGRPPPGPGRGPGARRGRPP